MTRAREIASQGGLVLLNTTDFSAQSSIAIDNVFSSTYRNYLVIVNQTSISGVGNYQLRFRTSGTDNTSSNYQYFTGRSSSNTGLTDVTNARGANLALLAYGNITTDNLLTFQVCNPNLSSRTSGSITYVDSEGNSGNGAYIFASTTVFDGFKLIPVATTTVTGTLKVYGYK